MAELKLPEGIRKSIDEFVGSLKELYENQLLSVVLYGSAAGGELTRVYSNINILVVLQNTDLSTLEMARRLVNKRSNRRIDPLFLSREYLLSSSDVFPIEFLDMREKHVCLYGEDIFKEIKIDLKNLRFQCEQELKSKLILLKQQYLRVDPGDKQVLANLLFGNFTSLVHILRNLLRLKGQAMPAATQEVFKEVAIRFGVKTDTLSEIWQAKKDPAHLRAEGLRALLADLVLELERIVNTVDNL